MGISVLGRNSARVKPGCYCNYCVGNGTLPGPVTEPPPPPNPNPENWVLLSLHVAGPYIAVKLKYPDCTNFEGVKILVYKAKWSELKGQKGIDPHFSDTGLAPVARFKPDNEGWGDACAYADRKGA